MADVGEAPHSPPSYRICSSALSIASARTAEWCMAGVTAFRAPAISGIPSPPAVQFSSARSPPSGAASRGSVCVRSFGRPLSSLPTRIVLLAHYASDVAAGLLLGALVGRTAAAALSDID